MRHTATPVFARAFVSKGRGHPDFRHLRFATPVVHVIEASTIETNAGKRETAVPYGTCYEEI